MAKGQMTFLQLGNAVLRRLGKSQVTSATYTATALATDEWPSLVKDFLNDAQREIAKEHDWSTLYTSGTFTTSSRTYDLSTTFSDFGREIDLVDTTNRIVLEPHSLRELDAEDPVLTTAGTPTRYAIHYPNLLFNYTPAALAYRIRYLKRATDLSASADVSILPEYCDLPMIWWAYWQLQATREDSQDGGERAKDTYEQTLARAIGQDRRRVDRVYRLQPVWTGWGGRAPVNLGAHYPAV
jgi:hypothetical protein